MGQLGHRLERLEGRYPARCRSCDGTPATVLIGGLGPRPTVPRPCPKCGAAPFVIEVVRPAGAA